MKLNGWSAGVIGMAAGAALSLAGTPAWAQKATKESKAPGETTVHAQVTLPEGSSIGDTGWWSFKSGGEDVRIETRDGKVISATRNGKDVSANRVSIKDGSVKITDDKGETIFEMSAPSVGMTTSGADLFARPKAWRMGTPRTLGPGATTWLWDTTPAEPAEPPKVMMGVTMAEPEYGLRKHCGLDHRSGTMVNEVYKGLPAAKAGIEPYDVIIEIDGKAPATPDVVRSVLASKGGGDEVTLTVLHKCEPKRVVVKLEAYDADRLEKARQEQMKAAGIEPPDITLLRAHGEFTTPSDELRGLIARIPTLDNKAMQDRMFMIDRTGADQTDIQQLIEAMKRATEGIDRSDAATGRLSEEKARRVEDRLDRLEKMLERLIEQKDKEAAPAKPATPPAPLPPKGSA